MNEFSSCGPIFRLTAPLRLLLVEEEPSLRLLLSELLRADYEVEVANNAQQAWESVQRQVPDVVLADVPLKSVALDAAELVRRLRLLPRTVGLLIVLLTSCNRSESFRRSFDAGADDFLLKPFRPPELLIRLRSQPALP